MSQDREKETEFKGAPVSRRKRVIHFANGDTLEQDSSDEEEAAPRKEPLSAPRKEPFTAPDSPAPISWREYSWRLCAKAVRKSIQTCDFIGGKLANLAGLDMAKYQYAIDQFHRDNTERSKREVTDEAPRLEEGAESIQLSPQQGAAYGATEAPQVPGLGVGPSHRPGGSHNQGYQED